MAFRLNLKHNVIDEITSVASEQIAKAIHELNSEPLREEQVVHQVRRRCKRLRALLRLVRPGFEEVYQFENAWFRDTARPLSATRDAQTMLDTCDALLKNFATPTEGSDFAAIRRQLVTDRQELLQQEPTVAELLEKTRQRMLLAQDRLSSWRLNKPGFKPVAKGVEKTYKRGRAAFASAKQEGTAEAFHEWRKRVKYHRYHCQLLGKLWPQQLGVREQEADRLGHLLGLEHDLAVLRARVLSSPVKYGIHADLQAFVALIDKKRKGLQARSLGRGVRLYAETPHAFIDRMTAYWGALEA